MSGSLKCDDTKGSDTADGVPQLPIPRQLPFHHRLHAGSCHRPCNMQPGTCAQERSSACPVSPQPPQLHHPPDAPTQFTANPAAAWDQAVDSLPHSHVFVQHFQPMYHPCAGWALSGWAQGPSSSLAGDRDTAGEPPT